MNKTYDNLDSIIQLSKDRETAGFDLRAGETWIYPTNYQIRDYQLSITQAALHNNTLVCLPTGLGKTFIAAVVMYNFFRWYPMGKIIFMAPTRPLVKQQQNACYNITAIPPDCTVEMTANRAGAGTSRLQIWKEKRVFFITPQILQNDIDVVLDLAEQIKCIVIDEAHKALGKHANCEAIKKIYRLNKYFRIVALSATPGNHFNSIKNVITNLLISHIEARTNESEDVVPFVFERKLDTFVIPITGQLLIIKNKYIMVLDKYTRPLVQLGIFSGNCANLTKGRIVITMKDFKQTGRDHSKYSYILKTLNLCVTLYHGYELLIRHGLRGFLVFFDGAISKPLISGIQELHGILEQVRNHLGPLEEILMLPDGTVPEIHGPVVYSHPKFKKLAEILIQHFKESEDKDTRVMVFCEYRESVIEIYQLLLRERPFIKPRVLLGQGAISQAQQLQAIKHFKCGSCNTLISTCIGEEGLDVGEVDLIVCFDISSKSPIRMVQRMGRTGRKRDGRVVVLVTEGKEQQLLAECMMQKNNMISLLQSQQIKQHLYADNPKMIPDNIHPQCNKMFITVQEPQKPKKKLNHSKNKQQIKNRNTLENLFDTMTSSQSTSKNSKENYSSGKSPVRSKGVKQLSTPPKKQMDLRTMFSKISNTQIVEYSQDQNEKTEECPQLKTLRSNVKSYLTSCNTTKCPVCASLRNIVLCSTYNKTITNCAIPSLSILNSISSESLQEFTKFVNKNSSAKENVLTDTNLNECLKFFILESIFDIFSNDSSEADNNCFDSHKSKEIVREEEGNRRKSNEPPVDIGKIENLIVFEEDGEDFLTNSQSMSPILSTQTVRNCKLKSQRESLPETANINNLNQNCDLNSIKNIPVLNLSSVSTAKTNGIENISTPTDNDFDFWDTSIFDVCASDESLFPDDNKENTSNHLEKSIDSNETVLSFDSKENPTKFEISNNGIDCSLLSVSQALVSLNKSRPSNSCTLNQTAEKLDPKILNGKLNSINGSKNSSVHSTNNINIDCNKVKIGDANDVDDFEEEPSLLTFTQNKKKKLQNKETDTKFDRQENSQDVKSCTSKNNINEDTKYFKNSSRISEDSTNTDKKKHCNKKMKLQLETAKNVDEESNGRIKKNSLQINSSSGKYMPTKKVIVLSDSDDDFEMPPRRSIISELIIPGKENKPTNTQRSYRRPNDYRKQKKKSCDFIYDEAEVKKDSHYISDSDSDRESGDNVFESSFVSHTQNVQDQTDMQAKYLQSIRSPRFRPGAFRIPQRPSFHSHDVYSQVECDANESYIYDSFCVENILQETQVQEMSYLEMIEAHLEKQNVVQNKKRKRIITLSDSD